MSKDDYEIGYGKPPKAHQFRKGECRNPKGRGPKPAATLAKAIEESWMAPITVTTEKGVQNSTGFEMIVLQLMAKIAKGNRKAHRTLLKYHAFAKTKTRWRPSRVVDLAAAVEAFEAAINGEDWKKPDRKKLIKQESAADRKKRLLAEKVHRMKAGLEPIEITSDMSVKDASDLWDICKDQPLPPPTRGRIRHRKGLLVASEIFDRAVYSPVTFREKGKTLTLPRMTALIKGLVANAIRGDIKSADMLVVLHEHSLKHGDFLPEDG